MKKLCVFVLVSLISNIAFADCNFKTDITPGPNHTFIYTEGCHLQVGQLVQTNKTQAAQITDLTKAIQLKDLALQNSDARVQLWQTTSQNMEERVMKIDSLEKKNDWLYFGLGVAATLGAGFMAARMLGK
jgi:hypothetical protein